MHCPSCDRPIADTSIALALEDAAPSYIAEELTFYCPAFDHTAGYCIVDDDRDYRHDAAYWVFDPYQED